jgi:hypothetical protein
MRIKPNPAKALTNIIFAQIIEINAEVLTIWKLRVVFALSGEVCVDLDAMSNVAN